MGPSDWQRLRDAGLVTRRPHEAHRLTDRGKEVLLALVMARESGALRHAAEWWGAANPLTKILTADAPETEDG